MAEALKASIPMLVLVQEVPASARDRNAFQELDHFALFAGVSKWTRRVDDPSRVDDNVDMAMAVANSGRPGPVVLLLPKDVLQAPTVTARFSRRRDLGGFPLDRPRPEATAVAEAARLIAEARSPLVVAGGGVHLSRAVEELAALQRVAHLPVVTTNMGKGAVSELDALSLGVAANVTGQRGPAHHHLSLIQEADVVLLVGTRTNENGTEGWTLTSPDATYIHIDMDPLEVGRNYEALRLVGDARSALSDLADALEACDLTQRQRAAETLRHRITAGHRRRAEEIEAAMPFDAHPIAPERLMRELDALLVRGDIVVADASYSSFWVASYLTAKLAGQRFILPRGLAGLGWGLPLGLGVKLATPDARVVAVVGDGGFAHVWSELETAIREDLPLTVIVLNNQLLAAQRHAEMAAFGQTTTGINFQPVDHAAMAQAVGAVGTQITNCSQLGPELKKALASTTVTVLDVVVDPDAYPPVRAWGGITDRINRRLHADPDAPASPDPKDDGDVSSTEHEAKAAHWPAITTISDCDYTIGDALRKAAARWSSRTALVEGIVESDARTWTYAELLRDSEAVARALLTQFHPGERVAVWSANSPEWVLLELGAALAGITLVTVNPAYRSAELEFVLRQSRTQGIFVQQQVHSRDLPAMARNVSVELPELRFVQSLDKWADFVSLSSATTSRLPKVGSTDPAQIQYTSGTTGFPKGAVLAHRALAVNGRLYAETIGATPEDVWVNPMPLFHTAGCGLATLGALQTGGVHVLPGKFDADLMLDLFEHHRGTILLSVPTMLIRMLDAQRAAARDLSSWRLATLGGAPVPVELIRRAQRDFGVNVGIGYGQTEAAPYITHTVPSDTHPQWWETVGRPLPHVEVKIANQDTGELVPLGELGEICTRSICVMSGYFENPEATRTAIDKDGWLHTGDLGSMDGAGYVRIKGRVKDMIIRGGENIYPREIEDLLFTHDSVADVSVVGLPHHEWGEIVAAFVQARPGATLTPDDLISHCAGRIASYKIPQVWEFVAKFPQTASGKIQKFALRDHYLSRAGQRLQPDDTDRREA